MFMEDLAKNLTVREGDSLVGQLSLDFTVFIPSMFEPTVREGVLDFYRQAVQHFGFQWTWVQTDLLQNPKRVDARVLEFLPSWLDKDARRREQYILLLRDGAKIDDIGTTSFECGAYGSPAMHGYLRVSLPWNTAAQGAKSYAELCESLVRKLPFISGRAGYSLRWNEYSTLFYRKGLRDAERIGEWYHGIDLPDDSFSVLEENVTSHIRPVNWLTFLNPALAHTAAEGIEALQKSTPSIEVRSLPTGVVIQAGPVPETGNSPKPNDLQFYRAVSRALKSIRVSSQPAIIKKMPQWLSRLDQDPQYDMATGVWRT